MPKVRTNHLYRYTPTGTIDTFLASLALVRERIWTYVKERALPGYSIHMYIVLSLPLDRDVSGEGSIPCSPPISYCPSCFPLSAAHICTSSHCVIWSQKQLTNPLTTSVTKHVLNTKTRPLHLVKRHHEDLSSHRHPLGDHVGRLGLLCRFVILNLQDLKQCQPDSLLYRTNHYRRVL